MTADTPPDPYGNYQKICGGLHDQALVECLWQLVQPEDEFDAFEITKRYAWILRGEGTGLLIKTGGENIVPWQGYALRPRGSAFRTATSTSSWVMSDRAVTTAPHFRTTIS